MEGYLHSLVHTSHAPYLHHEEEEGTLFPPLQNLQQTLSSELVGVLAGRRQQDCYCHLYLKVSHHSDNAGDDGQVIPNRERERENISQMLKSVGITHTHTHTKSL